MTLVASDTHPTATLVPFEHLRHDEHWRRWHELSTNAPPFLAPEFFSLSRPLADAGVLLVAEAFQSHALVGALPLSLADHTLQALLTDQTPGFDYCGSPEGLSAIWSSLLRDRRWGVLVLKNVPAQSVLATLLPKLAGASGCFPVVRPGVRQPFFALPGFEENVSKKFLTNLRRCARKAGGFELERIATPSRADLGEAVAIEAMGWKAIAGTNIGADPRVVHLYRAMLRYFGSRGRASLYFLRANNQHLATLFSLEDGHTLYALKIGYDPRHASVSPGHSLVWQVARDAERRGLREFNFVGHQDDWKRKWTEQAHEHVSLVIYRRSPRGLISFGLHEKLKPHLPEQMRDVRCLLRRGCQRNDIIGVHSLGERARGRVEHGLGIRSGVLRLLRPPPEPSNRLGAPARFAPGSWVRVLDAERIRATLNAESKLRGLLFVPAQWETAGRCYRVQKQMRRLRDDHGRFRPVARTVLLEGVTCTGRGTQPMGCGRHCPLMYREEWLEAAEAPSIQPTPQVRVRHARVRGVDAIRAGLDLLGQHDGLSFMPEMAEYCNRRFPIAGQLSKVFEYDRWAETRKPIYILAGLNCIGEAPFANGPCDRACALLWHEDWLLIEPQEET
ncbi:MAG TPA: GNAT family N-acetyltransferase [Polyangiaceae bacterium]